MRQNKIPVKGSGYLLKKSGFPFHEREGFFVALTNWSTAFLTSLLASFKPTMISNAIETEDLF